MGRLAIVRDAKSWNDLERIQEELGEKGRWIYRGQRQFSWPLASTLERAIKRFDREGKTAGELEGGLLRQFARRAHHYFPDTPGRKQWVEWLALMQHHGAPTRLLDFTYSFNVGVFFALEDVNPGEESALWALNVDWADECLRRAIGKKIFDVFDGIDRNIEDTKNFRKLLGSHRRMVFAINPYRLNQRLSIQQGVFLCPGDVSSSFNENLAAYGDSGGNLIKFRIKLDRREYQNCIKRLIRMNMTRTTLFPGFDGFAASQKMALATPHILMAESGYPK